jgi:tRNA dimethylallyltransferase
MLKDGAIDEVESLLKKINNDDRQELFANYTIFNTLGAKEITLYLDGVYTFERMKEIAKMNSRRYAKRQMTWLNNQNLSEQIA